MINRYFLIILFACIFSGSIAQEILSGLQYNEAVRHEMNKITEEGKLKRSDASDEFLQLPFFDDFAKYTLYPDETKWIGNSAFINKDFPLFPPNAGAATFDAIDGKGVIYSEADWIPFKADEMTSRFIRLDSVFDPVTKALSPADSIYLSFYYQPQGAGDEPESWDTLILEFAYRGDTVFSHVDSVQVPAEYWLASPDDTIPPLTPLKTPDGIGCDTNLFIITYEIITWNDLVTMPCDSVFGPDTMWKSVWHAEGMKLSEFKEQYGRDFVQVMVPLYNDPSDSIFFYDSFQFRFRNYASIADDIIPSWRSNQDQWNVDYVYLDYNRFAGDTTYRVLTFSQKAPTFLKEYQVMPYRQYRAGSVTNLLKPSFEMFIANLDDVEHNTTYEYQVQQVNGNFNYSYYGGSCNLQPFDLFGFQNCNTSCGKAHACPPVNSAFNYDYSRDTTSYTIKHYISDSSETDILIDSIIYTQGFYNYYAYDDGTPEFGWGMEYAGSIAAYQFTLSMADTLRGVQMYFNSVQNSANDIFFQLLVYKDNNGKPGEEIYRGESVKPQYENGLYEFYTYMFDEPIILSGTFYVGWQQLGAGNLNIGFDANNDNSSKIFFTIENEWVNSAEHGSLLIRPIIGQDLILGTGEKPSSKPGDETIKIYPNPAGNYFNIDQSEIKLSNSAVLHIYNIYGSLVHEQVGIYSQVDISTLPKGMYFIKIDDRNKMYTAKLLINR